MRLRSVCITARSCLLEKGFSRLFFMHYMFFRRFFGLFIDPTIWLYSRLGASKAAYIIFSSGVARLVAAEEDSLTLSSPHLNA